MRTVTYEEFLKLDPGWLYGEERIKACFDRFEGKVSALDILNLDNVSAEDRLWSVLREEFISIPILHEFACVCAEYALTLIDNPDPRSIKAVEVKRAWLRGEATDEELATTRDASWDAARDAWEVARDTGSKAAWNASWVAWTACDAVSEAASEAAWTASNDASSACAAIGSASEVARDAQVAYLIMTLEEDKLRSVLREEAACACAEHALTLIDDPDPRCIKALEVKRAWLRGEATDEELDAACVDARAAAREADDAAWAAKAVNWALLAAFGIPLGVLIWLLVKLMWHI